MLRDGEEENCRCLGGITGHEGLVCLVGLHLECVGGQFKGMESFKKKGTSAKGSAPCACEVPVLQEYIFVQYHSPATGG